MSRWIRTTDDPAWAALFTGFQRSAYRLEGQQLYSNDVEDYTLARFVAGEPYEVDLSWTTSKIAGQVSAGRTQTKVRIVMEPPNDYTRLELTLYPEFAAAGEDVRIIAVDDGRWPEDVPRHDYWLFDERDLWRMHYHEDHRFAGAELIEDPDQVAQHLRWRDAALAQSVPVLDYLATHPQFGRSRNA